MDGTRAAAPCTVQHRPPLALARAHRPRQHPIRAAHRLRVAAPAAGLPALEHDASLVLAPVEGRRVRAPRSRPHDGRSGAGRTRGQSDRLYRGAQAAHSGGVGMAGERSYDQARRAVGHKRHALTNTYLTDYQDFLPGITLHRNHEIAGIFPPQNGSNRTSSLY